MYLNNLRNMVENNKFCYRLRNLCIDCYMSVRSYNMCDFCGIENVDNF